MQYFCGTFECLNKREMNIEPLQHLVVELDFHFNPALTLLDDLMHGTSILHVELELQGRTTTLHNSVILQVQHFWLLTIRAFQQL